jgi:hypothetical protein
MPDAAGNFKGISLGGKAAEAWERIFGERGRIADVDKINFHTPEQPRVWEVDSEGIEVNEDGTLRFTVPFHYITRLEAEQRYGVPPTPPASPSASPGSAQPRRA